MKRLKSSKAPGEDRLDNQTIKLLPYKAVLFLVAIFNAALRLGYFPVAWKKAHIIMLHKSGKPPNQLGSYRPISLLPAFGKILERCILRRVLDTPEIKRLIPKFQFGFRLKHGTPEQLHRVTNYILDGFHRKEYVVAAYLDIQEAFDRVWHAGLLSKIKDKLNPQLFSTIASFLTERTFQVVQDGVASQTKRIKAGVPQGSVLGPTLYSLFTHDMPTANASRRNDRQDLLVATFADDTAILAKNKCVYVATDLLQEYLKRFENWACRWNIAVNPGKCATVTHTLRKDSCPGLFLHGELLEQYRQHKYLGVTLDRRLTFSKHVSAVTSNIKSKIRRMSWLLNSKNKLSLRNKVLIYKVILAPVWRYGLQVYGIAAKTHLNKIRIIQAKTLRKITGAEWYIRTRDIAKDLKVPMVGDIVNRQAASYSTKLHNHPNILARSLLRRRRRRRLKRTYPTDLIDRYV
ncbi:RNA-directed DNA polymerase from mobile element jockey isoform X5 [Drosophila virilis]|uniref:RNA-directed DNA polymerase from mobile element jockey isoform X5 n=1 Tax=Drosophila virilis TaxID=7244 RepID=UPI0038B332BF